MRTPGRSLALAVGLAVGLVSAALGQALPSSTKVDVQPIELTDPRHYEVVTVFEPIRRVTVVATADGVVRSQDARAGATVREGQDIAQLDRSEAGARLKIAQAEVKEHQALVETAKLEGEKALSAGAKSSDVRHAVDVAQARLEAAQARAELIQIELDRCTLRAPFPGRVLASHVSDGQFVAKGTVLAELADVSSLRAFVPVVRAGASVGGAITLTVEGNPVSGKIQALLPLPESFAVLRELGGPITAAWVVVPNTNNALEPGERVVSPALPNTPVATIPAHALKTEEKGKASKDKDAGPSVQVIRNEYVTSVKVRVLGSPGPDRVQVTGPLRPTDALIVSSSVPLLPGTLIRFNSTAGVGTVEGTSPNPADSGAPAELTPPGPGGRVAPIGAPGSAVPKGRPAGRPTQDAPKPAAKAAGTVPF